MTHLIASNRQLFDYLVTLSGAMKQRGCLTQSEALMRASQFFSGSASEFLHAAELALSRLEGVALTSEEESTVRTALRQIRTAFARVGGA